MRTITAVVAALGVLGVLVSTGPARADDDDFDGGWRRHEWREHQRHEWREHQWREQRWREHEWREHASPGYAPPTIYVEPGYVAQPRYYAPPQAYYVPAPPPPPPYYAAPGFSLGFGFR